MNVGRPDGPARLLPSRSEGPYQEGGENGAGPVSSTPTVWHITVPGGLDAPSRARHALSRQLNGELDAECKAEACLLLHELVANSVIHAGADTSQSIGVRMRIDDAA